MPRYQILISYVLWTLFFRLFALTIITYLTAVPSTSLQDVADTISLYEITLAGLSASLFLICFRWISPLHSFRFSMLLNQNTLDTRFLPGFLIGALLAAGFVLTFLLNGTYQYLGFYAHLDDVPWELIQLLLNLLAICALVYCEEYLFRNPSPSSLTSASSAWTLHVTALFYCWIKFLQFDLSLMQLVTLYLFSISLSNRARSSHFAYGAGILSALLIVFHPILSLPIFGNDFRGLLTVQYQAENPKFLAATPDSFVKALRFFTGGVEGPFSSFAFQLLLILDIGRMIWKKNR